MRRGEVQNWHFINAAIFNFVNLSLDDHALNVYSHDGNPRRNMLPSAPAGRMASCWRRAIARACWSRRAHRAPTTCARCDSRWARGSPILDEDVLAEVVVVDPPLPMALPSGPLPVPAEPGAHHRRGAGERRRIEADHRDAQRSSTTTRSPSRIRRPARSCKPGDELADWVFQTGKTTLANKVFALGSAGGQASTNPGMPTEYIPFQSSRALKQTVALGSVEEWTIFNMNPIRHPFHIHVNPFQVVKINGAPIDPYWADTIALPPNGSPTNPTSVTFRTRFRDFAGAYVMHCHMLAHEDMGMMQTIEIFDGTAVALAIPQFLVAVADRVTCKRTRR